MIPVLGVPVLNRPDLLRQMLESIDVPVGRLVIVDNGGVTGDLPEQYWAAITEPPSNIGVAASWNFIIRTSPLAPWWAIVNSDMRFAPGDLARLDPGAGIATLDGFAAFGISASAVERAGLFDENFIPAYCEDTDYRYRCRLAGVPIVERPFGGVHLTSSTYRSDERLAQENARTYPRNVAYYRAKWGGWTGQERFTTPFDRGGSVADWALDFARLRELTWRRRDGGP